LFRSCATRCSKEVIYKETNETETVDLKFFKWPTKTVDKEGKTFKVTVRDEVESTIGETVKLFDTQLSDYMGHVGRINHQRDSWALLQKNLSSEDLLINADWSENWNCKFTEEIQSMHFGASHTQISLHTGMVKTQNFSETFCTVSENNDHGPKGVFAHLKPILQRYVTPAIKRVHFMTDGPTTQYRSGKMFKVVAKHISAIIPGVEEIIWNFSESGHGKSVSDGVGGTTKRTADSAVLLGIDITDAHTFVNVVSKRCP